MVYYVKLYVLTLVGFLAIDMLWLGLLARGFYSRHLGFLLAPQARWPAAAVFYLLFIVGLLFFVVLPGLEEDSLRATLARAALFGLITYATYDLTNLATLRDWPVLVTVVDIVWGVALSVAVSALSFVAGKWLS